MNFWKKFHSHLNEANFKPDVCILYKKRFLFLNEHENERIFQLSFE